VLAAAAPAAISSASFLAASCKSPVSTSPAGTCTNRTTEPLMNAVFSVACGEMGQEPQSEAPLTDGTAPLLTAARGAGTLQRAHLCCTGAARLTSWGNLAACSTVVASSLKFRYWSTLCSFPRMETSFFISTTTSLPISVLKNV